MWCNISGAFSCPGEVFLDLWCSGALTSEQYEQLGEKQSATPKEMRAAVYSVYKRYESLKKQFELKCFDYVDVVQHICRSLSEGLYRGPAIEYVFIDEVQDLTPAEAWIVFQVCPEQKNSFMFVGDSCQTISRGLSFRFSDLRSLFLEEANARKARKTSLEVFW